MTAGKNKIDKGKIDKDKIWIRLMKMGAKIGCHQRSDRSFFFKRYQFPLCARCTGLFIGQVFGFVFAYFAIKLDFLLTAAFFLFSFLLLGIDGIGQLKGKWISTNRRRLITGLFAGFFLVVLAVKAVIFFINMIAVRFN